MRFSTAAAGPEVRDPGCQPGWGLGWGSPLPGVQMAASWLCPQGGWEERSRLLTRTLILFWGLLPHDCLSHPPKTLLLYCHPLGLGFNEVGAGDTSLMHSRSLAAGGRGPPPPGQSEPGWEAVPAVSVAGVGWGAAGGGRCLFPGSPHFLGPVWEQVQLPGVVGAWVRAVLPECGRAPPPPCGDEHVPGAWDGRCAGGPQRHSARCRLSGASSWGA